MTIFLIIFLIMLAISVWGWCQPYYSDLGGLAAVAGSLVIIAMSVSTLMPVWDTSFQYFDATSQKLGNEIIVQSPGLPTQIVTDIKFIEQPLVVVKQTNINLYGWNENVTYFVQIKKTEK